MTIIIGYTDEHGYTLRRQRGPVEMWESPEDKGYKVNLIAAEGQMLFNVRKHRKAADTLFDSVCLMLPGLASE